MSVTIVETADLSNLSWGPMPVVFGNITLDSSYPAGGYGSTQGLNAAAFSLRGIEGIYAVGANTAGMAYLAQWNTTTSKLMMYTVATFTPSSAGGPSAPTITILGGSAPTPAIGIATDANGAALSKTTAGNVTGITGVQAPTITLDAVAAGLAVVGTGASLATVILTVLVFGIR